MTDIWTLEQYRVYERTGVEPGAPARKGTQKKAKDVPPPLDRYQSDTERRYAALLEGWRQDGQLRDWRYAPCKGLYLGPKDSYTPDFLVQWDHSPFVLAFHEVKGAHIYQKDRIHLKWAATAYPFFTFVLAQWKDQVWTWTEIPAV